MTAPVWFAVQTWPRYEKKAAGELQTKEIEVFLPLYPCKHQWSDRRRIVQLPLFPGYVFVKVVDHLDSRIMVLRTSGVTRIVGSHGTGTPIPDCEIDVVRKLLGRGVELRDHSFLNVGQRVRVRGGSLDGTEGMLVSKSDDLSLVISIQLIQRSLAIRLAGYRVEAA
jgi:transcription antitermination factor NusG